MMQAFYMTLYYMYNVMTLYYSRTCTCSIDIKITFSCHFWNTPVPVRLNARIGVKASLSGSSVLRVVSTHFAASSPETIIGLEGTVFSSR